MEFGRKGPEKVGTGRNWSEWVGIGRNWSESGWKRSEKVGIRSEKVGIWSEKVGKGRNLVGKGLKRSEKVSTKFFDFQLNVNGVYLHMMIVIILISIFPRLTFALCLSVGCFCKVYTTK